MTNAAVRSETALAKAAMNWLAVIGQGQRNETRTRPVLRGAVPSLHDGWPTSAMGQKRK